MPPTARRKPRARRPAPQPAWRGRVPVLEQRHWDLIGLALVAFAIFLAFLVYLDWDGGEAGGWLVDGCAGSPARCTTSCPSRCSAPAPCW